MVQSYHFKYVYCRTQVICNKSPLLNTTLRLKWTLNGQAGRLRAQQQISVSWTFFKFSFPIYLNSNTKDFGPLHKVHELWSNFTSQSHLVCVFATDREVSINVHLCYKPDQRTTVNKACDTGTILKGLLLLYWIGYYLYILTKLALLAKCLQQCYPTGLVLHWLSLIYIFNCWLSYNHDFAQQKLCK